MSPECSSHSDVASRDLFCYLLLEGLADQRVARQVLAKVLVELLVLLHPLMPHLSEELWHGVTGEAEGTFLAVQTWPAVNEAALDDALEAQFAELIEGLVDLAALRGRLEKDIAKAEKEIKGLAGRLANPNFAGKAPPEVVAECRANLAEAEAQAALARGRLEGLE